MIMIGFKVDCLQYLHSDDIIVLPDQLREVVLAISSEIMTFYLPIFFTFRSLSSQNPERITKILKFWCVLSISYILQYVYSLVLAQNLDIIIDLALHAVLIYDECTYSEQIYDSLVRPFYKNNEETINNFSKNIEKYFEKKTQQVQSKVSESAADKIKSFMGQILVGTLNPANKKKEVKEEERPQEEEDEDDEKDD